MFYRQVAMDKGKYMFRNIKKNNLEVPIAKI